MPGNLMGSAASRVKFGARGKSPWRGRKREDDEDDKEAADKKLEPERIGADGLAENEAERNELRALRKMIREAPNVFLLNNLVLATQLFNDYEKEMKKAWKELLARETELNEKLHPEKVALMPDVLREHFDGRVRFTSHLKSNKEELTVEPLRPVQIYLCYENVLVTELDEPRHYHSPGDLTVDYTFVLKETDTKGYARLEHLNSLQPKRTGACGSDNTDLSSIAENQEDVSEDDSSVYGISGKLQNGTARSMPNLLDEDIYSDDRSLAGSTRNISEKLNGTAPNPTSRAISKLPSKLYQSRITRPQRNVRFRSTTSPFSASSSSSGYTTNYGLDSDSDSSGTSRLNGRASGNSSNRCLLSKQCFSRVTYTGKGRIYNPHKEKEPLTSQERRIRQQKLALNYEVTYVNAEAVAEDFYKLFKKQLAKRMGFERPSAKSAKKADATVRLEEIHFDGLASNFISIENYEVIPCFSSPWPKWASRWLDRAHTANWPGYENLSHLSTKHCHLVPESLRTSNKNPLWQLDWNLSFPIAERYLETRLSSAQAHVYATVLMMHKIFFRISGVSIGLDVRHIRHMLFWLAETTPSWSDHEMGKHLLHLLTTLHHLIQRGMMRDYFMEERNLFDNLTVDELLFSQKQLHRILENPVMFVFHALEKIHYERSDLPRLDYKELLSLLTRNELVLINPNLAMDTELIAGADYQASGSGYAGKRKFWSEAKQTSQYNSQTRKRSMKTQINPREIDSIIDIQEKCELLTRARLSRLLDFFSGHFLKMAHYCHRLGAAKRKKVYLDQTRLLALLLADDADFETRARGLLEQVNQLRDNNLTPTPKELPPETPKRNSADHPISVRTLKDRFDYTETEVKTTRNEVQAEVHVQNAEGTVIGKSMLSNGDVKATRQMKKLTINEDATNGVAETTTF